MGRRRQDGVRDRDARVKGVKVLYGRRAHQRCTDAAERYRWRFLLVTRSALKTFFLKTGAWDGAKDAIYMCARETFNTGSEGGSRAIERRSEEIG